MWETDEVIAKKFCCSSGWPLAPTVNPFANTQILLRVLLAIIPYFVNRRWYASQFIVVDLLRLSAVARPLFSVGNEDTSGSLFCDLDCVPKAAVSCYLQKAENISALPICVIFPLCVVCEDAETSFAVIAEWRTAGFCWPMFEAFVVPCIAYRVTFA